LDHFDRLKSLLFWDSNGTEEWDNNPGRSNLPSPFHNPSSIAERLLSKSEKDCKAGMQDERDQIELTQDRILS
jgi:hypothetical protein